MPRALQAAARPRATTEAPPARRAAAAPALRPAGRCACGGGCPSCRLPAGGGEAEAERFADGVAPGAPRPARGPLSAPRAAVPTPRSMAARGGRALDAATRAEFEGRFGADLSQVRVHDDADAAASATGLHAHAYTFGEHVVFGAGQHRPQTPAGRHLLAHELAHTVQQQAGARHVQGSFWDDVTGAVASVGHAIGEAASAVGGAISAAASWLGERVRDVAQWAIDLVTQLPARLLRLGQTLVEGFWGIVSFIPEAIQALAGGGLAGLGRFLWERLKAGGAWILRLVTRVFDVVGGPEAVELLQHIVSHATPLTEAERRAGQAVLGEGALRWDAVRIAEGGYLYLVFAVNHQRAVTTFHTINMPTEGDHGRANKAIVVHELTHVMQYERTGSWYIGQAIHAQATVGYEYGGADGLRTKRAEGGHFASFNREQQAQIAQDYYTLFVTPGVFAGADHDAYLPFIEELRRFEI
jgi:hypothetical protein